MKLYPTLTISQNKNPNKFYAVPLIGFIAKIIMLIPVFIEGIFLCIAFIFFFLGNSCVVLFTGKYWDSAYTFFLGLMRFYVKIGAFVYGITDTYPGFTLSDNGLFTLEIEKPAKPSRLFAIPFLGFLIRIVLLIPYFIFTQIMQNGARIAILVSWFPVLFSGRFPESVYEFEFDTIRLGLSAACYITGLSDSYPSFRISMNHKSIKILLLIAGTLLFFFNNGKNYTVHPQSQAPYQHNYYNSSPTSSTY
ncbi:MAG: DUF4389 domain-containing protein [Candidatus Levyibacteriota bacterium]